MSTPTTCLKMVFAATLSLMSVSGFAQEMELNTEEPVITRHMPLAIEELVEYVAIPNDAVNGEDIRKNITWAENTFQDRKFSTQVIETEHLPIFLAEKKFPGNQKTVLFYFHLDGQPIHPADWDQEDPYTAVLREQSEAGKFTDLSMNQIASGVDRDWRLYGRSSADDKGPIIMLLHAMDIMEEEGQVPPFNVKVVLDSEEEKGSGGLKDALQSDKEKLMADYMIVMDGPMHPSNLPTLTFGCRGGSMVRLTTYGPVTPQHSGHFGNYAPNPVFKMARLLATMKDEHGRALIKGFYDDVKIDEEAKKMMAAVPDDEEAINKRLLIAEADQVGDSYQEALQYPSLNIRGMQAAEVGKGAATIIPDKAEVLFDIRLVPETDGEKMVTLVRNHIEKQGYTVLDHEPTPEERLQYSNIVYFQGGAGSPAFRTDPGSPMGTWLRKALADRYGQDPVMIRMMGGTVPVVPMIKALDIPAVLVPLVNQDNNQHSPNENLRMGNLYDGIKTCLAILSTPIDK